VDHILGLALFANVRLKDGGAASGLLDTTQRPFGTLAVRLIVDSHGGPACGHPNSQRVPNALAGTGNQDELAF
jgi:hypothetical protein